jgi:putative endopeptidase
VKTARTAIVLSLFAFGVLAPACAATAPAPPAPPATPTTKAPPPGPPPAPQLTLAQTGIETTWMDTSADPCQDYFAYACGGFVKTMEIPADRSSWGTTPAIEKVNEDFLKDTLEKAAANPGDDPLKKKLGDYYAACMDEGAIDQAGLTPIAGLLEPIAKVKDFASLAATVARLHADNVFVLWDVGSQQDFKDATRVIAGLDQSGIGLPDRDYYLKDDGNLKEVREFYTAHVGRMLTLGQMKPAEVKEATADVLRIEGKLAKLQQDKVARRDPYKIYHRVDRAGLPKTAATFPWDAYWKAVGLPDVKEISINEPSYFTGVDALLHQEKPTAWRHYLTWHVLRAKASMLTKALVNERFAMRQKLTGQKELEPRWKRCVRGVDDALGELLGQPYVSAKFAGDSKARAKELVGSIHAAMKSDLQLLPWMDDQTRTAAIQKLEKMNDKVGYPDTWRVYDFPVTRASYAANAMAADRFELKRRLAKVGKPVDRAEWDMTPPTVNAYYNPSMNEIVLPAGELQPPFFSKDFYAPVNIGDEGANTIGHEITHGFDDEGSQFDGDGNLRDWWSKDTKAKFVAVTKCVVDQYAKYEAVPGVKLNGELTAGENIADIGGVKLGYAALVAWKKAHPEAHRDVPGFTDEQLFFLAYSQGWCSKETPQYLEMLARTNPHSPPRFRVNGPMADVPAFAEAYACRKGTPMNSGEVCSVW